MNTYVTGTTIKQLREQRGMTQAELADRIGVGSKAVSKWETGKGLPDSTLLQPLAQALGVSVIELLQGQHITNRNISANLLRSRFYVCPVCGNVIQSVGEGVFTCCGVTLPKLEAEDGSELIRLEYLDGEQYVHLEHPMTKGHFISFLAYVTTDRVYFQKLYPEQEAEARFPRRGHGHILAFCNRHGLFSIRV